MRPRKATWPVLSVVAVLLLGACSNMTFVRQTAERGRTTHIGPDYRVRETPEMRQRMRALDHSARSSQLVQAGQLDDARREAQAGLRLNPELLELVTGMGVIEARSGNAAASGQWFARAVELAPRQGDVLNNYGAWLCGNGRASEAMQYFDRALADPAYPYPAAALTNAGSCAAAAGEPERVERFLRAALSLQPQNPVALASMADYRYRNGLYLEARAFSQRRLAAAPATAAVLQLAILIEEQLGDTAAANRYRQRLEVDFPGVASAVIQGVDSQP